MKMALRPSEVLRESQRSSTKKEWQKKRGGNHCILPDGKIITTRSNTPTAIISSSTFVRESPICNSSNESPANATCSAATTSSSDATSTDSTTATLNLSSRCISSPLLLSDQFSLPLLLPNEVAANSTNSSVNVHEDSTSSIIPTQYRTVSSKGWISSLEKSSSIVNNRHCHSAPFRESDVAEPRKKTSFIYKPRRAFSRLSAAYVAIACRRSRESWETDEPHMVVSSPSAGVTAFKPSTKISSPCCRHISTVLESANSDETHLTLLSKKPVVSPPLSSKYCFRKFDNIDETTGLVNSSPHHYQSDFEYLSNKTSSVKSPADGKLLDRIILKYSSLDIPSDVCTPVPPADRKRLCKNHHIVSHSSKQHNNRSSIDCKSPEIARTFYRRTFDVSVKKIEESNNMKNCISEFTNTGGHSFIKTPTKDFSNAVKFESRTEDLYLRSSEKDSNETELSGIDETSQCILPPPINQLHSMFSYADSVVPIDQSVNNQSVCNWPSTDIYENCKSSSNEIKVDYSKTEFIRIKASESKIDKVTAIEREPSEENESKFEELGKLRQLSPNISTTSSIICEHDISKIIENPFISITSKNNEVMLDEATSEKDCPCTILENSNLYQDIDKIKVCTDNVKKRNRNDSYPNLGREIEEPLITDVQSSNKKFRKKSIFSSVLGIPKHVLNFLSEATQKNISNLLNSFVIMSPTNYPNFTSLPNLASKQLGGKILFATDELFGVAENLLNDDEPILIENKYTEFGKWVDGWETRRRRSAGYDWCIIQLGLSGIIKGIDIDTKYFTGNYAPKVSIQAAYIKSDIENDLKKLSGYVDGSLGNLGTASSSEYIGNVYDYIHNIAEWLDIIKNEPVNPGYSDMAHNYFKVDVKGRLFSHLRFCLHPDGGIARLRVYGQIKFPAEHLINEGEPIDLCSVINGGLVMACSNQHFSNPNNLLLPHKASNMGNGWETARALNRPDELKEDSAGRIVNFRSSDWVVIRLGFAGVIECIEIDTTYFKGNHPDSFSFEVCDRDDLYEKDIFHQMEHFEANKDSGWTELISHVPLKGHSIQFFCVPEKQFKFKPALPLLQDFKGKSTHIRLTIFPDGGISRLRIWGRPI